jgi:hypothetical protein
VQKKVVLRPTFLRAVDLIPLGSPMVRTDHFGRFSDFPGGQAVRHLLPWSPAVPVGCSGLSEGWRRPCSMTLVVLTDLHRTATRSKRHGRDHPFTNAHN